jgi:unsaturated rhamnogalacturonyl hydrolase
MDNLNLNEQAPRVNRTPTQWATAACHSLMNRYSPMELPPENKWHYHQGVFLMGMLQLWESNREIKYLHYVKEYVDRLIDEYGNFYFQRDELDAMQAGLLLFTLEDQYGDTRYRIAADKLRQLLLTLNVTSEGGFWHKDKYPYQMWLDGLYMGGVFSVQYARRYDQPELIEQVLLQEKLMRAHMKDERTGLLYHAWDEKRATAWANKETGCSPEFWGRSLGWYGIALVDILAMLPEQHPAKFVLSKELSDLVYSLIRYQDKVSGMWYQVVDKPNEPDNWLESSCTSLFIYTIASAIHQGIVTDECRSAAVAGYEGLLEHCIRFDEQGLIMTGICIGTSAGDYMNYVTRERSENDLHGVGAFVMACCAVEKL